MILAKAGSNPCGLAHTAVHCESPPLPALGRTQKVVPASWKSEEAPTADQLRQAGKGRGSKNQGRITRGSKELSGHIGFSVALALCFWFGVCFA